MLSTLSLLRISRRLLLLALLPLGGCGADDQDAVRLAVIGDAASPFETGGRLPLAAQMLRSATTEGLVAMDAEGHVTPALADRWIVTADGMGYIFRLRDGRWADGSPVTGESARAALRSAIDGLEGTPLAQDLAGVSEVRAMAGRVIEVRLSRPMPDLLQILAQSELGLTHRGKGWGPMEMKRTGAVARLSPIAPEKRGLPEGDPIIAGLRKLRLVAMPGEQAVAAFAKGDVDVVLGGGFVDLPRNHAAALSKSAVRQDPVAGLFGLVVVRTEGLLATPTGREAVAMVIDRDSYGAGLGVSGWQPTTRIVMPGAEGDAGLVKERWAEYDINSRRNLAARRINQWIAGSHQSPVLRIALPVGPGADILFDRVTSDFGAMGITAQRAKPGEVADLRLIDSVARYPRVAWYLNQLSCAALRGPCSVEADAIAAKARAEPDPAIRATLWAEAEQDLTKSNVFIPLGAPVRWSLVRGNQTGFAVNPWGFHSLISLSRKPN